MLPDRESVRRGRDRPVLMESHARVNENHDIARDSGKHRCPPCSTEIYIVYRSI